MHGVSESEVREPNPLVDAVRPLVSPRKVRSEQSFYLWFVRKVSLFSFVHLKRCILLDLPPSWKEGHVWMRMLYKYE